jgi:cytochrome-b5 reductase
MGAASSTHGPVSRYKQHYRKMYGSTSVINAFQEPALVPSGICQLHSDWTKCKLLSAEKMGESSLLLNFELPDLSRSLGLSTCACILARGGVGDDGVPVIRPYTPLSTNNLIGSFELMVKVYPDGKCSQAMAKLKVGDTMDFKHVGGNVKIQYPFNKKKIGMICCGTGITPMIQALFALLNTDDDQTEVVLIYASAHSKDILLMDLLDSWSFKFRHRFTCHYGASFFPSSSRLKQRRFCFVGQQ